MSRPEGGWVCVGWLHTIINSDPRRSVDNNLGRITRPSASRAKLRASPAQRPFERLDPSPSRQSLALHRVRLRVRRACLTKGATGGRHRGAGRLATLSNCRDYQPILKTVGDAGLFFSVVDAQARFEQLYRENGGAVRAFVHRRIGGDDADDVVSEVFLAAWRRLEEAPKDSRRWLFGLARGGTGLAAMALDAGGDDRLRVLARFFAEQVCPEARALAEAIMAGGAESSMRRFSRSGEPSGSAGNAARPPVAWSSSFRLR